EKDAMTYTWDLGNGETKTSNEPTLTHTFNAVGDYEVKVTAKDPAGLLGESLPVLVYSGNTAPEIQIVIDGNQSFYFPGKKVSYTVTATDQEDAAAIDLSSVFVSADYVSGIDLAEADMGHK